MFVSPGVQTEFIYNASNYNENETDSCKTKKLKKKNQNILYSLRMHNEAHKKRAS